MFLVSGADSGYFFSLCFGGLGKFKRVLFEWRLRNLRFSKLIFLTSSMRSNWGFFGAEFLLNQPYSFSELGAHKR